MRREIIGYKVIIEAVIEEEYEDREWRAVPLEKRQELAEKKMVTDNMLKYDGDYVWAKNRRKVNEEVYKQQFVSSWDRDLVKKVSAVINGLEVNATKKVE